MRILLLKAYRDLWSKINMDIKSTILNNKSSNKRIFSTAVNSLCYVGKKKYGKQFICCKGLQAIFNSCCSVLSILFPGILVDLLIEKKYNLELWVAISFVIGLPLIQKTVSILLDQRIKKLVQQIELIISEEYFSHICRMDYEHLENPDIQLLQERAESTLNGITSVVDMISTFIYALISLIAVSTIVIVLHPAIIVLICLSLLFNSWITQKTHKETFDMKKELDKLYLQQSVFPFMLTHIEYAKEIRLFNCGSFLINRLIKSTKLTNEKECKIYNKELSLRFFGAINSFIQQIVIYIYLLHSVIAKALPIGTMTIYLNATMKFSSAVSGVLKAYLSFSKKSLHIQDMIDFFNIPQKQYTGVHKMPNLKGDYTIEFENVSFRYPGSERYAIRNLNLVVHGEEKLCIVGENGSGKSTFIKLLTRLYMPTEGEIKLNGVNIYEYDYATYLRMFSPVFQDFSTFSLSLKDNVFLSEIENYEKLEQAVKKAGLYDLVCKLANGYDTNLDKDLDEHGVSLSGGEAQKMAIARALYHEGYIYILDEPTAALDPLQEYEIYTRFNEIINDKCAILITHRLSAVQLADKVAVFDDGKVVEYGTHEELYRQNGIYREMFDKQAQFYRKSSNEKK